MISSKQAWLDNDHSVVYDSEADVDDNSKQSSSTGLMMITQLLKRVHVC